LATITTQAAGSTGAAGWALRVIKEKLEDRSSGQALIMELLHLHDQNEANSLIAEAGQLISNSSALIICYGRLPVQPNLP
jgi:uncharacterized RDD family membrane protein YckC